MADQETPSNKRPTVLIVDDDTDTLNLMSMTIQRAGYVVRRAPSGSEALKVLDELTPDAIILDLMMPMMSGMEVMRLLKIKFPWPPPVIMFTAKGQIEDKVEGLESGAFRYLVKPVPREALLAAIKDAVNEKRGRPRLTGRW
jgi:two-component system, OmpR family, response regulator VicR